MFLSKGKFETIKITLEPPPHPTPPTGSRNNSANLMPSQLHAFDTAMMSLFLPFIQYGQKQDFNVNKVNLK